jgi:hypothetical protein
MKLLSFIAFSFVIIGLVCSALAQNTDDEFGSGALFGFPMSNLHNPL